MVMIKGGNHEDCEWHGALGIQCDDVRHQMGGESHKERRFPGEKIMAKKYKFTPNEKMVGFGMIGSIMSIDSVLKSNYGGFKYRRQK